MATMTPTPLDPDFRAGQYCPAWPYQWPIRWCGATVTRLMALEEPPDAFSWAFTGESERSTLRRALRAYGAMRHVYEASLLESGWEQVSSRDHPIVEGTACVFRDGDVRTEFGGVYHAGDKIQVMGFWSKRIGRWVVWGEKGLVAVLAGSSAHYGQAVYQPPYSWENGAPEPWGRSWSP